MTDHFTALVVSVTPAAGGYYEGYDVSLNGVPLWFRPYDGADQADAVNEVTEALCEVLRAHTGRALRGEADDHYDDHYDEQHRKGVVKDG